MNSNDIPTQPTHPPTTLPSNNFQHSSHHPSPTPSKTQNHLPPPPPSQNPLNAQRPNGIDSIPWDTMLSSPFIFQCKNCRTIVGDTSAWWASFRELRTVALFAKPEYVAVDPSVHVSKSGADMGCSFRPISCTTCRYVIGKQYVTTPNTLDSLREMYCFDATYLTFYKVGSFVTDTTSKITEKEVFSLPSTVGIRKELVMLSTQVNKITEVLSRLGAPFTLPTSSSSSSTAATPSTSMTDDKYTSTQYTQKQYQQFSTLQSRYQQQQQQQLQQRLVGQRGGGGGTVTAPSGGAGGGTTLPRFRTPQDTFLYPDTYTSPNLSSRATVRSNVDEKEEDRGRQLPTSPILPPSTTLHQPIPLAMPTTTTLPISSTSTTTTSTPTLPLQSTLLSTSGAPPSSTSLPIPSSSIAVTFSSSGTGIGGEADGPVKSVEVVELD